MAASSFLVNCKVRAILARHWIDLQKIRFHFVRGTLYLKGELRQLGPRGPVPLDGLVLERLEWEIRGIPGVKKVYFLGLKMGNETGRSCEDIC